MGQPYMVSAPLKGKKRQICSSPNVLLGAGRWPVGCLVQGEGLAAWGG